MPSAPHDDVGLDLGAVREVRDRVVTVGTHPGAALAPPMPPPIMATRVMSAFSRIT